MKLPDEKINDSGYLHNLMFGLLYPAVLGSIFYTLLTTFSEGCFWALPINTLKIWKIMFCIIIVGYFCLDFAFTHKVPHSHYGKISFFADIVVIVLIYFAFTSININNNSPIALLKLVGIFTAVYTIFILWLFQFREHMRLLWSLIFFEGTMLLVLAWGIYESWIYNVYVVAALLVVGAMTLFYAAKKAIKKINHEIATRH
ncbi:MAG: hypothetical protein AB2777_16105 [Candidatus Thiodiazotropha endolucinida]